jgi:hypothetical protein
VVPTLIANASFLPHHLLPQTAAELVDDASDASVSRQLVDPASERS